MTEKCDLCDGTGINANCQLWPGRISCRACKGTGKEPQRPDAGKFTGPRIERRERLTPYEVRSIQEQQCERNAQEAAARARDAEARRTAWAVTTAGQRGPEQGRFGYFRGMIVITHPDMPPHVWDGKKMTRVEIGVDYGKEN